MNLLSIDPGKHHIGWAKFSNGILNDCGLICFDSFGHLVRELFFLRQWVIETIIEVPQVYQQKSWRGDPNDLIDVALVAGAVADALSLYRDVKFVRPHAWKGNRPKNLMCAFIENKLTDAEKDVLAQAKVAASKRHNVLDAIGIGLWALERL